jgi:uncharacterized protein YgiM (DUF1202 family)
MRLFAAFLTATLLAASPGPALSAGAAYVVRSPSTGLFARPNAGEQEHTLIRGHVVTVLERHGEWYRIITGTGREGWVRERDLTEIPAGEEEESRIDEASPDEVAETAYFDFVVGGKNGNVRREPRVGAPIVRTAEGGEVFTIVAEEGSWFQVSRAGKTEGWMHESVGVKQESRNLSLRVLDLLEARMTLFDQFKSEVSQFRRMGWFPSFFLRDPEEDLVVARDPRGGREVTVNLSYGRREIEYRTVTAANRSFLLPEANRVFLSDLLLSLLDMSPEVRKARLHLWFAALEADGSMSWQSMGEVELDDSSAEEIPREGEVSAAVWAGLSKDTTDPGIWEAPAPK